MMRSNFSSMTSLAGVAVSSRLFIDEEYTIGTYPTPDCKFVLSVVRTFLKLSAQQPAQIFLYCSWPL
eukprot:scaffold8782_cov80-Skeletonema_dohrnii-CCMP3373.AAC.2